MQLFDNYRIRLERLTSLSLGIALFGVFLPMSPAQADPSEELKRLEYFEGEWTCQQPADSSSASGEFVWNVELGLNNYWYLGNAEQTQTPADGQPINSQEFLGYDLAAEKLVRSVVVGNGNFYNVTADDWQNEKLVWQGIISINGKSTALRQEMVRDSPNRFVTTYFALGKEDSWLPIVNESCDRET